MQYLKSPIKEQKIGTESATNVDSNNLKVTARVEIVQTVKKKKDNIWKNNLKSETNKKDRTFVISPTTIETEKSFHLPSICTEDLKTIYEIILSF